MNGDKKMADPKVGTYCVTPDGEIGSWVGIPTNWAGTEWRYECKQVPCVSNYGGYVNKSEKDIGTPISGTSPTTSVAQFLFGTTGAQLYEEEVASYDDNGDPKVISPEAGSSLTATPGKVGLVALVLIVGIVLFMLWK